MSGIIYSENLSYDYNKYDENGNVKEVFRAIDSVNIEINKGEFVAILGHNGSGKSTFAKNINVLYTPTEGKIYFDNKDTSDPNNLWDIRQNVGMIFQNPDNQIIASVVEEDIAFGPENLGIERKEIIKRVDSSLNSVDMNEYRYNSPHNLSGGQKQRIAIAGVLAMKPQCIVLDEPTAMLDPFGRKEVIRTIEELNKKEGITIVLITHYMEEVINADRVIVMEQGKVVMEGSPKDIFSRVEDMKKLRLDVPQVTEIAYNLNKNGINIRNDILSLDEMVDELCQYISKT